MFARIREDIKSVFDNDPAAKNLIEVVLTYPGLHALWLHRIAHRLYKAGFFTLARMVSQFNRSVTGIEIHPGAVIGRRVFIDHGMGVVIGETAEIGDDCLLYKGVVLGGTSTEKKKRHPTLGRCVVVGSNACVLGAITIGHGARIGSGSVVVRNVPAGATVVGVPGRVVRTAEVEHSLGDQFQDKLQHADLPDPLVEVMTTWMRILEKYEERIKRLEQHHQILSDNLAQSLKDEMGIFSDGVQGKDSPCTAPDGSKDDETGGEKG